MQAKFKLLDTVLIEKFSGKVSQDFVELVDSTKERIKSDMQQDDNATFDQLLQVDKAFDSYLESKY
ncbi:hypothetical protein JXM83_05270 [Candidatus Woesearchaeota archaeon]|nr:hypothetical protein [Candidatus Woesearchaeota archaeon]